MENFTLQQDLLVGDITGIAEDYDRIAEKKGTVIEILSESPNGTLAVSLPNYHSETFPYNTVFFVSENRIEGYEQITDENQ